MGQRREARERAVQFLFQHDLNPPENLEEALAHFWNSQSAQAIAGALKVQLIPQGTLAERIRAGGAGIPAFFTPTGVGTLAAEGKEQRTFDGRDYLLEMALKADFALVKAWKGDRDGNLIYRRTARNFNPMMATAARVTIAEVEELVEPGELDPDAIVTPGIYVKRIFACAFCEKRIERRTVRKPE